MKRQRNPGRIQKLVGVFPDCAEFILGHAEGVTRGLIRATGYGHTLIVVVFTPTGCPNISDSVSHRPSLHTRHSPAAAPCRRQNP
jgi:hypothetical protein